MTELFKLIYITLPWIASGYDLFEGITQQDAEGCFENVNTFDSDNCSKNLTLSREFTPSYKGVNSNPMNTKCFLFTAKNPYAAELLNFCGGMLPSKTDYDPTADTIVITHGFIDGVCHSSWMREYRTQFFKRDNRYNIILCDWTWGNFVDPSSTAANARVAGEDIGFYIKNIMIQKNVSGDRFYLIGHSYGSVVMSIAAKLIVDWNPDKKVRRMTWLEPAGGPYPNDHPKTYLNNSNAKFTDSYHSGSGVCFPTRFATLKPVGHADFYFNSGRTNPACYPYAVTSVAKGDLLYAAASVISIICYHLEILQYFKVSINPPGFPYIGVMCDSYTAFQNGTCERCCLTNSQQCAVAGVDAEYYFPHTGQSWKPRTYYLNTDDACPYPEDYNFSIFKDCPAKYKLRSKASSKIQAKTVQPSFLLRRLSTSKKFLSK